MSDQASKFLFVTCQVGAESLLKAELGREHPELRLAFSRPGFLTFKGDAIEANFELRSAFARAYGLSLGRVLGTTDDERLAQVKGEVVHVWERDREAPDDDTRSFGPSALAQEMQRRIAARTTPVAGERVLDLVLIEPWEWWLGEHVHGPQHAPYAGGVPTLTLPPEAPSRAYLKIEEAARRFELPLAEGDRAVEVGSAPGGASFALLQRGLTVIGIDPAEMHPNITTQRDRFRHIQRQVGEVPREDLPKRIDWLFLDMNAEPDIALGNAGRLLARLRDTLKGLVFTLKLGKPDLASRVPEFAARVAAVSGMDVVAKQLVSNRKEITLVGRAHPHPQPTR